MTFAQFARLKRTEVGITISECAAGLGITPDAYLKKEQDNRGWSLEDAINLAIVYGLKTSELLAEFEAAYT
jgi:transcriptional regulator with XRE-family HTH domain